MQFNKYLIKPDILYVSENGSTGPVSLPDNWESKYKRIVIECSRASQAYYSVTLNNPKVGRMYPINIIFTNSGITRFYVAHATLTTNSINISDIYNLNVMSDGVLSRGDDSTNFKIYRVLGYKY